MCVVWHGLHLGWMVGVYAIREMCVDGGNDMTWGNDDSAHGLLAGVSGCGGYLYCCLTPLPAAWAGNYHSLAFVGEVLPSLMLFGMVVTYYTDIATDFLVREIVNLEPSG